MPTALQTALAVILIVICARFFPAVAGAAQTSDQSSSSSAVPSTATISPPVPADAAPLPSPAMTGPLTAPSPILFDAGPFGKLAVNGVLSGFGLWQNNPGRTDQGAGADISNGQIVLQKTTGVTQFYLQAGAYTLLSLGTSIVSTSNTITDYYGALPVAYFKLAPTNSFAFMAGKLTSLLGAEYTFTFENGNIERGLLWNQENSVTRGVQLNYCYKKLSASMVWGDGFYSNRWNWITGALTYTSPANSLEFVAGGNLGHTRYATIASPGYQNNSSIYNVIYTHTAKLWTVEPYFQYTYVPAYLPVGVERASSTQGEAILGSYKLPHHMSLAGRLEFISSTGSVRDGSANLLYGPGSNAGSVTITPTYQNKAFFTRGEISYARTGSYTPGDAFGPHNTGSSQVRGLVEAGFLF